MSILSQKDLSEKLNVTEGTIRALYDLFLDKALKVGQCVESERERFERAITRIPPRAYSLDNSVLANILWELDRAFENGRSLSTQHKEKRTATIPTKKVKYQERSTERDFYIKKLNMLPESEVRHYCATVEQLREWVTQDLGIKEAMYVESTLQKGI